MFGWLRRLFGKRQTSPVADTTTESLPANTIRLDADREYSSPSDSPYADPGEVSTYRRAHRAGWEFFAQGSYTYLGSDGRPNGKILGRGACEREYRSEPEQAGFIAGFDQAKKLHFQRVREAINSHFAGAAEDEPDAASDPAG